MVIQFDCFCQTVWGQDLYLIGDVPELGQWNLKDAVPLKCVNLNRWCATVDVSRCEPVCYKYVLYNGESFVTEIGPSRVSPQMLKNNAICCCIDSWQDPKTEYTAFLSSAFANVLFVHDKQIANKNKVKILTDRQLTIGCTVPKLKSSQYVAITGSCSKLGNWADSLPLSVGKYSRWQITFDLDELPAEFEYKFVVKDISSPDSVQWEQGCNHLFVNTFGDNPISLKIDDGIIDFNCRKVKFAGVNVPVFSLRTSKSFGVGDFSDLRKLVDWVSATGLKIIQILPINDTISTYSFLDSYPYNAISVFALNPLFLDIFGLGKLNNSAEMSEFENARKELNAKVDVDYEKVIRLKLLYCKKLLVQNFDVIVNSKQFTAFVSENSAWLEPYVAFCIFRDKNLTSDFGKWGKNSEYSAKRVRKMFQPDSLYYTDAMLWCYIQFGLDRQLKEATAYARKNGVILKGDIPIGISRRSVDAWCNPSLFNFGGQAGAPPDFFSETGQNWGFPTYNWDEMAKDGFAWWRQRLAKMNDYFDAYRIDHILGFFRIWEIPVDAVYGTLGHFSPSMPLTISELHSKNVNIDYDSACCPQVDEETIDRLFGEQATKVKDKYLRQLDGGLFTLSDDYSTQRKIYDKIVGKRAPESLSRMTKQLLDGLLTVATDVLLLKDCKTGGYHPRIDLRKTSSYKRLSDAEKSALDAVYDDYFFTRHNDFWRKLAETKLSALLKSSDMLVCGEDLGMIPDCVKPVMEELGILSLEIQRMPKTFTEFVDLQTIPYTSVCATSTHDISTIRGWWQEDRDSTQRYYNNWLKMQGEAPAEATPDICKEILVKHFESPAMCVMVPIQDYFALEPKFRVENPDQERINVPANPRNYWKYRMHVNIETLLKSADFNILIVSMLNSAGRNL